MAFVQANRGRLALAGLFLAALPLGIAAFGTRCGPTTTDAVATRRFPPPTEMPDNLKVVFLGDSGAGTEQREVLTMVRDFGASFVVHLGDFDYDDDPDQFLVNIHDVLGDDYPYFVAIGNHDLERFFGSNGYQARMTEQLESAGVLQYCEGEVGVQHACYYQGLYMVLSGIGTWGLGHPEYIDEAFSAVPATWKVCGWHKNQRLFQLNTKSDETGYAVYDTCRQHGAIVATGHEHSYSRTFAMASFSEQVIANYNETVTLRPGETFCFVSGLGGQSIRDWDDELAANPWWAAKGALQNDVSDGALFCTFKVNGQPDRAHCTFRDTRNVTFDDFDIITEVPADRVAKSAKVCRQPFFEVAVADGADDAVENLRTGAVFAGQRILRLGDVDGGANTLAAFRFAGVPLVPGAAVEHAYLQVFGTASNVANAHGAYDAPELRVRLELAADAAPIDPARAHAVSGRTFTAPLVWTSDGEDFEARTVWNSVDLAPLLREVVHLPGWRAGHAVLVTVEGRADLTVATTDRSACQAPTLAIELEREC